MTRTKAKDATQHHLSLSTSADEYSDLRLDREVADCVVVARFTIPGEPVSKARARFTKRGSKVHTYTPEKTMQAERQMAWVFREVAGPVNVSTEEEFGVLARFFNGTRQRRDVDNMIKLILDALNGVAWADDMQVSEVSAAKRYVSRAEARTEVLVYSIGKVTRPTRNCKHCGVSFRVYPSWPTKVYCTDDCRLAQRRAARERTCEECGKRWDPGAPSDRRFCSRACMAKAMRVEITCTECGSVFTRSTSYARASNYCSGACSVAASRKRRVKVRKGDCIDCGGPVSRKEYQRCLGCSRAIRNRAQGAGHALPLDHASFQPVGDVPGATWLARKRKTGTCGGCGHPASAHRRDKCWTDAEGNQVIRARTQIGCPCIEIQETT